MLFAQAGLAGEAAGSLGSNPSARGDRAIYRDDVVTLLQAQPVRNRSVRRSVDRRLLPDADGAVFLLDGDLFNRPSVAERFFLPSGGTDRDFAAAAFSRQGHKAVASFIGDFALVRWEASARRLTLAVDQTGSRALFYCRHGAGIIAASTIRAMLAHPLVPRELDQDTLGLCLINQAHTRAHQTIYRHIRLLPAGHGLTWENGKVDIWRYWQPDPTRRIRFKQDDDYIEAARELLDRAVACRMPAEGVVLSHLSGGLDSAGVAATAARLRAPEPVHSVTVRPDPTAPLQPPSKSRFYDEWEGAQQVAALYPNIVTHAVHPLPPDDRDEEPGGRFWTQDWPRLWMFQSAYPDSSNRFARQMGADAILTGDWGNLTLSWEGRFTLPDRLKRGDLRGWARTWRELAHQQDRPLLSLRSLAINAALPAWMRNAWRQVRGTQDGWLALSALNPTLGEHLGEARWPHTAPARFGSIDMDLRVHYIEHMCFLKSVHSHILSDEPVRPRAPLGDIRLIEFCLAIPGDLYLRDGQPRSFARRVLADRLPPATVAEPRQGGGHPEWFTWMDRRRDWMMNELARCEASPVAREVLNLPKIRRLLENWPRDVAEAGRLEVMLPLLNTVGRGLRVGQFIYRAEGRND